MEQLNITEEKDSSSLSVTKVLMWSILFSPLFSSAVILLIFAGLNNPLVWIVFGCLIIIFVILYWFVENTKEQENKSSG